jgi:hypothetical protein
MSRPYEDRHGYGRIIIRSIKRKGDIMKTQAENCFNCVYSQWDRGQAMWNLTNCVPTRPTCANHPELLGRSRPTPLGQICRNFRARTKAPGGDVKQIPLSDGYCAYVDATDYEWLSQWTWHLYCGYAGRWEGRKTIFMHREIVQPGKGMVVDHKNRNKLDNTRENLRACTHQENMQNAGKQNGATSRFRGVSWSKKDRKWLARICCDYKQYAIGYFTDEVEAARAYDRKAVELFGDFARLNFPEEWPQEKRRELREAVKCPEGRL